MSARTKSPLHPSALSLNDIQPGRRIIEFNRNFGVLDEAIVFTKPYVLRQEFPHITRLDLVVTVRLVNTGFQEVHHLADMGVIPYVGSNSGLLGWSDVNFTIDARKRDLLPKSTSNAVTTTQQMIEQDYWTSYERELAAELEAELDATAW